MIQRLLRVYRPTHVGAGASQVKRPLKEASVSLETMSVPQ